MSQIFETIFQTGNINTFSHLGFMSVLHFQIKSSSSGEKKQLRQNLRYMFVKKKNPERKILLLKDFWALQSSRLAFTCSKLTIEKH